MAKQRQRGCLILAGKPREAIRRALEEQFGFPVMWPAVEPTDRLKHFRFKLHSVHMMIVAVRFCRKGARNLIKAAERRGISVLTLPAGYSVAQIADQMRKQGITGFEGGEGHG
jgi:hypothetical protein